MEGNTCPVISPPAESPKPPDLANTGTNTGGSSPKVERDSPEPNCAICLGKTENKSFTDSCLHQFCFNCLLEWSKVKAECPLCKQSFKSIIHNVRSNEDYDQYHLHSHAHAQPEPNYWPNVEANVVRVRYRTTLTAERQRERFLESLMTPYFVGTDAIPPQRRTPARQRARMFTSDFRALVYRDNLWVNPLPDITGRYRECSPEFYRMNPAQVHRLAPWLNRELSVLRIPSTHLMVVMELILNLLTRYPINSLEFRGHISPHVGVNTDHFIHEFFSFARSPYDMMGFDQSAEYRERAPTYTFEMQPLDSDSDSDVIVLSPSSTTQTSSSARQSGSAEITSVEITESTAGTSRAQERSSPVPGPSGLGGSSSNFTWTVASLPQAATTAERAEPSTSVSLIDSREEVLDSDSDDCVIVGYVKPRHERTPEIITLDSEHERNQEDRESTESYLSDLMFSPSSSNSTSDSDFTPYGSPSRKRAPKRKKMRKMINSSSDETFFVSKRKLRLPSSESDSTVTSHSRRKRKRSKSKGKRKREPVLPDTSDDDSSESLDSADAKRRKNQRDVWRIVKKQEPENDHDYSLDCYDPPYTEEEVATFSSDSRPKLRSIVITKSSGSSNQRECSYSSVASSSRSSSRHHESRKCRRRQSHKHDERKRKNRRRSESPSPIRFSKIRRKTKHIFSPSDSSSSS